MTIESYWIVVHPLGGGQKSFAYDTQVVDGTKIYFFAFEGNLVSRLDHLALNVPSGMDPVQYAVSLVRQHHPDIETEIVHHGSTNQLAPMAVQAVDRIKAAKQISADEQAILDHKKREAGRFLTWLESRQ